MKALLDDLSATGPITVHSFFGGKELRWDGVQLAIVMAGTVHLHVDDQTRADLTHYGAEPFRYRARGKQVSVGSYLELPSAIGSDVELLCAWVQRARQ